jgi:thioredoxin 1
MLAPTFEQLETEFDNVEFETVDIDENRDMVVDYNIRTVPTVVIEQNGHVLERLVGLQSKNAYEEAINTFKGR